MASKLRGNVSLSDTEVLLLVTEGELDARGDPTGELSMLLICERPDSDREDLRILCSDGELTGSAVDLGASTVREYRFASTGVIGISVRGVDKAFLSRRKLELQVL